MEVKQTHSEATPLDSELEELACLYAAGIMEPEARRDFELLAQSHVALKPLVSNLQSLGAAYILSDLPEVSAPSRMRNHVLQRIQEIPPRVRTDTEGRVISINSAFTALCGFSFAEVRGQKPGRLLQGADSDPDAVAELRAAQREHRATKVELINYHKDGSAYRVAIDLQPLHDEGGDFVGFEAIERKIADLPGTGAS